LRVGGLKGQKVRYEEWEIEGRGIEGWKIEGSKEIAEGWGRKEIRKSG